MAFGKPFFVLIFIAAWSAAVPVQGASPRKPKDGESTKSRSEVIAEAGTESLKWMQKQEWEKALTLLVKATEGDGKHDYVYIPTKLGNLWYRRGYCEFKLERYTDAMKSFSICYRDFPNREKHPFGGRNIYHKRALLKWADAARCAEDYETAARLYKKFIRERNPKQDHCSEVELYSNLSFCCSKIGKTEEAARYLAIAAKKRGEAANTRMRSPATR